MLLAASRQVVMKTPAKVLMGNTTQESPAGAMDVFGMEVDVSKVNDQKISKAALQRIALAEGFYAKAEVLQDELWKGKVRAAKGISSFFDALQMRSATDEEKLELEALIARRRQEERRWASESDPNLLAFPVFSPSFSPEMPVLRESLRQPRIIVSPEAVAYGSWWKDIADLEQVDVNENVFPLRHFSFAGEGMTAVANEVTNVDPQTFRADIVADTSAYDPSIVGEAAWDCMPPAMKLAPEEKAFFENFWAQTKAKATEDDFDFSLDPGRLAAWRYFARQDIIEKDITTPEQDKINAFRSSRKVMSDKLRRRRIESLARYFSRGDKSIGAPDPSFFEECVKVLRKEDVARIVERHIKEEATMFQQRAAFGSKFTSFSSSPFAFKSAKAKSIMDVRMGISA
eukprot:g701.t1